MENFQVTLQLPIQWVNVVLAALAKQPFESVADAHNAIRAQAQTQIDAKAAADQGATGPTPPAPPEDPSPPDAPQADGNRKARRAAAARA